MRASIANLKGGIPGIGLPIQQELRRHQTFPGVKGPVVTVVMDGVGIGKARDPYNAVARAETRTLDRLKREFPYAELHASGIHVGLLPDNTGNSEVGHNALGAGRWIEQGSLLIDRLIKEGTFTDSKVLNEMIAYCRDNVKPLHLLGLLQRHRSVHSHTDHLKVIVGYAAQSGVKQIFAHGLIDGRDDPAGSARGTFADTEQFLASVASEHNITCRLASGGGRMTTTLDRYEADAGMIEQGWATHVRGEGRQFASGVEAIKTFLAEEPGRKEQDMPNFVIAEGGQPVGRIEDGNAVITLNYRGDRMVEICQVFEKGKAYSFFQPEPVRQVEFAGMLVYDADRDIPSRAIVVPPVIEGTMSQLLAVAGIPQLAIAETQKYGHVTYFWNGNNGTKPASETWIKIPSDPVNTFEAYPAMKVAEVTARLMMELRRGAYGLARVNFPHGDMVGHTGNFQATVRGVEAVDQALSRLKPVIVDQLGGALIVTADHGNADQMVEMKKGKIILEADGSPKPRIGHTSNKVPFYLVLPDGLRGKVEIVKPWQAGARTIRSVAATALNLMGFATPSHMDPSLIEFVG
ncbi:MAG: 2,3-bisphosphoglycerate-independent phosphoglycerate mutase [Candidatus Margulisiibacteriota bacterium]